MIRLGIDTGGTYTDAVVVDLGAENDTPKVLAKAKSLTTKGNLTRGILSAIDSLPPDVLRLAEHVALSTTLATNACVENKGGCAKLIIVGTTDEVLRRVDARGKFGIPYEDVLTVKYEGSYDGEDVRIPNWEALYEGNRRFFEEADSFGIASVYSMNNGAAVEKSGAAFLKERFGKLVVEASTVAMEPNVIGRGATALLNARLVPVVSEFLDAIDLALKERGILVPVSIVRSDGTLMSEELARMRPVETILSGPAASVTGAQALAGAPESLVVDIGGTTSDISIIHDDRPNRTDGILIGGWKTQVAGVYIDTIALGGDTVVRYTKNSRLELGTRKVTPLCIAASRWPMVKKALKHYLSKACIDYHSRYELYYLLRDPGDLNRFREPERQLITMLKNGPVQMFDEQFHIIGLKTDRLEDEGIVMRCGMTPTDAMHIKGDFDGFDVEASVLGARCLLKSYRGVEASHDDAEIERLADEIYALSKARLFGQVVRAFSQDQYWPDGQIELDAQMQTLVDEMWNRRADESKPPFGVNFSCNAALVGVGAPTHVFLEEVASVLGAPCVVPDHAEVANAVGAAASRVAVEQQVRIHPLRGSDGVILGYQVRSNEKTEMHEQVDEALNAAREMAQAQALAEARRRGANAAVDFDCSISVDRCVYTATGVMEIVREWVITARVG